ncbi:unnamed protein product [Gulo gulo]|uniref:Uncharacterized protein n=1 Tax=Gulo gulo TaxID=48420 RepID=A0A9X9PWL2_GULGU|nr:unnamed protein product [Gulo gulo]
MSCTWHCSRQMSVGIGRIIQNPGTNWVPMLNLSSPQ